MTPSACTVTPGFPIRKSQDQSLFDSSPGLIAAYHVLHRLITPRHPPYTLSSLATSVHSPLGHEAENQVAYEFSDTCFSMNLDLAYDPGADPARSMLPYELVKEPSRVSAMPSGIAPAGSASAFALAQPRLTILPTCSLPCKSFLSFS